MNAAMLSPMLFTHCTPRSFPVGAVRARSLQIYSIKVAKIKHLKWPLDVYGVVAARDYVDNKRNILFYRTRHHYQTLRTYPVHRVNWCIRCTNTKLTI